MLSVFNEPKLRRVLERMLDETEFLSEHGVRSLSKYHLDNPYVFHWEGREHAVQYLPAESDSNLFGGNSNWRGPVWVPANFLLIRGLFQRYSYFGEALKVDFPTGSGAAMSLYDVADELGKRLLRLFLLDTEQRRAVYGDSDRFQEDPNWRDHLLFYEYFDGDDGSGVGAGHQTGWTGCVATLLFALERLDPAAFEEHASLGKGLAGGEPSSP